MDISTCQRENLKLLALLHDIGIIAINSSILYKKDGLTQEEEDVLKSHTEIGYRIASASPDLAQITSDILSHHEQWGGKGYPQGISGESIPLNARIISVLDTYDRLTHGGMDKRPLSKKEALEYIKEQSGKRFDPKVVDIFVHVIHQGNSV